MNQKYFWAATLLLVSAALHGVGFGIGPGKEPIAIKGGAAAPVAMLGNSFADMAVGVMTPTAVTTEAQQPVAPAATTPTTPTPPVQETPQAQQPTPAAPATATPIAKAPSPTAPALVQSVAKSAATPVLKPVPKPAPKPEPRPKPRKPVKQAKPKPKVAPKPAPRGNSGSAGKRGQSDGQASAKATQSSQGKGTSRRAGNAAVANYPGKVWRKLSRTRKRGRGRGKAVVGFKIASSGGVASAWIIRSSGNARLDAAAVKHVHRAAPFPRPPKGAKRQYSYDYVGK